MMKKLACRLLVLSALLAVVPFAFAQIQICPVTTQVPTGSPVATLLVDAHVNACYATYGDPNYPCCPAAASLELPAGQYIAIMSGNICSTENGPCAYDGTGGEPAALPIAWGGGSCESHSSANSCILIDPRHPSGGPLLINHPGGRIYSWRNDNYWGDNYGLVTITFYPADITPPTIASVKATPALLWPPNHKMVPVKVTVEATDDWGSTAAKILAVTSNEPNNGLGDGDQAPDWEITGDLTLNLRAERSGKGSGRVYTVTIECTDESGNKSQESVNVAVPHDQRTTK